MKRTMAILALAGVPALAACGERTPADAVTAEDVNQLEAVEQDMVTNSANQVQPGGDTAATASAPEPSAPLADVRDTAEPKPKAVPAPALPSERPAPPPPADPHAGHDMGNMSNISH